MIQTTMKIFVLRSLLLARFFYAIAAHPQITPPPDLVIRQAANNVCGYYLSEDNSTSVKGHNDALTLLTHTSSAYTLTCPLDGECAIATTTAPAIIFCPTSGIWGDVPVTSVFGYDHWPLGGCTAGQLCWLANPLLTLLRPKAKT